MTKTLIIWETVPNDCFYHVLDNEEHKDLIDLAVKSAGCYINADELDVDHPIYVLSDKLDELFPNCPSARSLKEPLKGPFSQVIICGFFL